MWLMGKAVTCLRHSGRYLAAQMPMTMREVQGCVEGGEGAEAMVLAISRITVSASLSNLMSRKSQMWEREGSAR